MKYTVIPVTMLEQNCTVLWCEETKKAAAVDPGGDADQIIGAIEQAGVELEKVLLTHLHIDHVGAAGELAAHCGATVVGPPLGDEFLLHVLPQQAQMFGVPLAREFSPDQWLGHGDTVEVGQLSLEVRHCPGHTPGHVIYYGAADRTALTGDVLFRGSIGRTDFPRGDYDELMHSIHEQLLPLGDEVTFVSGHGPESTFGHERLQNPFLNGTM